MLTFEQVGHRYGARQLFDGVSLTLPEQRIMLTGDNGIGKTTLLMIAAGLISPTSGMVLLNGENVQNLSQRRHIGISASKVNLPVFFTVTELLQFQARQFHCEFPDKWVGELGLSPFLNTKIQDLSLGNAKKLSLILALMFEPALLLLDEPTNGLDAKTREALHQCFRDYPGQIIMASHEPGAFDGVDARYLHLDVQGVHEK